jgi:hypothetical protein
VADAVASPRPAAEVQAEIDALNARLDRWVYELPQYSRTNLTKRLEDLLKPLPTESEAPAVAPGDGSAALDALEGGAPVVDDAEEIEGVEELENLEEPILGDVEISDHEEMSEDEQP